MFERLFAAEEDEKTLIEKAKINHHDFARLYERFVHVVYRFVHHAVANREDRDDIVAETFMAVAMKLSTYDTTKEQKFTTRLLAIAKYKLADHWRVLYKAQTLSFDESVDTGYDVSFLEMIEQKDHYDAILACVETLPPQQKLIFSLRYIEELSNKEIAELCELTPKTISSLLSMVTKKIVTQLKK